MSLKLPFKSAADRERTRERKREEERDGNLSMARLRLQTLHNQQPHKVLFPCSTVLPRSAQSKEPPRLLSNFKQPVMSERDTQKQREREREEGETARGRNRGKREGE